MKAGDKIKVITDEKEYTGILMPNETEHSIFIKLDNGYNMGIEKGKIKSKEILEERKARETIKEKIEEKKGLKKIVILHTGGTIASKVDYSTGAVTAKFTAEEMLLMIPELAGIANIETELVANMMSEDMVFSDYKKIARAIERHKDAEGIIIGHGTDTLTFTAAALAFIFERINIPVLIVGSQRSTDRGSSDAAMNLLCAAEFIAKTDFTGVAICMHHDSEDIYCSILPATKTRKMHTSRRDAFKPINDMPIASIDSKTKEIKIFKQYSKKTNDNSMILKDNFEDSIGLLKTHPVMKHQLFEFYSKNYSGFVLEGTGLGHAPTNLGENNLKSYEILKEYIKNGGIVAVTSQCIYGRVHPSVYTNLRRLSDIGCIFCEDMLPETAFIKLAWLLGNYPKEEAKKLLAVNLRGEITERSPYEKDFCK